MSVQVDPFIQPIPREFSTNRETRAYIEYLHRFLHDLWVRTGGGDDAISNADIQEKYSWQLQPLPEERFDNSLFQLSVERDSYRAVTVSSNYTANDYDFINATGGPTITLSQYPCENATIIIRNGDGAEITINGNGRNVNGETDAKFRSKNSAITLQYFIDSNEWFAR